MSNISLMERNCIDYTQTAEMNFKFFFPLLVVLQFKKKIMLSRNYTFCGKY